ncbi:unnamed protein product [Ambrosiozyma monospora]|uniref:Unnamed protein product n=1 Tax=Ambrosiozyma monospora TaxID=43982 RepID=A0ACB5TGW2_AMBMO|nr:unnamed protein product [Ambrosiozyma monospora]
MKSEFPFTWIMPMAILICIPLQTTAKDTTINTDQVHVELYEFLNVSHTANKSEIKKAFVKKVKRRFPDKQMKYHHHHHHSNSNSNDHYDYNDDYDDYDSRYAYFFEVYQILIDDQLRLIYDLERKEAALNYLHSCRLEKQSMVI